jgi:hypothetical protein
VHTNCEIDWTNFNSCHVIEVFGEDGITKGLGVAVRNDILLSSTDLFQKNVFKIKIYTIVGPTKKRIQLEVECFDLHPEHDVIRIKLKEKLPLGTMIYPIMKDKNNFKGKLIRLGFVKNESTRRLVLIQSFMNSISFNKKHIELSETQFNPHETGSGIFIIREGQIYLLGLLSLKRACKKTKTSKNPLMLGLSKWVDSSWYDRSFQRA